MLGGASLEPTAINILLIQDFNPILTLMSQRVQVSILGTYIDPRVGIYKRLKGPVLHDSWPELMFSKQGKSLTGPALQI